MKKIHELTTGQLEELAGLISQQLINHQEYKNKRTKEYAYHNTRLLLRNYDSLKKHCMIVDEQTQEDIGTLWGDWRLDINALLENKAKTVKIMRHVDNSLIAFKEINREGYYLLTRKFFSPNQDCDDVVIADEYDVDRSTIVRRIKKSCEELSIILFGIDMILLED